MPGDGAGTPSSDGTIAIQKLQPRLRMVANGDTGVNAVRAEQCSAVALPPTVAEATAVIRTPDAAPVALSAVPPSERAVATLTEPADAVVSVFVQLADEDDASAFGTPLTAIKRGVGTAELPVAKAVALAENPRVALVELGQPLTVPRPSVRPGRVAAPATGLRRFGKRAMHRFGADVLIGIIDVGGFDFAHPDFLDRDGRTRFVRIWDQGGTTRDTPAQRETASFDYGAELLAEDLNAAIAAAPGMGLPAVELEPQSRMVAGSHGTHVASIAAGNRGLCREAEIAAVLVSVPDDEEERRRSFYDSTRLAHAVDYLIAVADSMEPPRPIAINISLGTNGHAHDDSAPINRWIDASLTRPGRCVCAAAGNAGQERAQEADDVGWIMGRVHSSGRVGARELVGDIEWVVVGNGISDLSENELEIWYGPQDRFSVQVRPPGGEWTARVRPGEFIENRALPDGSFLSVYNELYHPANGANLIGIYLSPRLKDPIVGVTAGEWLVRLHGDDIRDGRYHCWIERDDPRPLGRLGRREAWSFPSFFSETSFVDSSTVSTLACGQRLVSVANLDADGRRINISSSQGPTRDEREKPDIAAPGTDIVAAKGFAGNDDGWVAMTGTSMASPFITGLAGLMLAVNPELTAAQIGGILRRTARPLPASDYAWKNDAGAGAVDPERCLEEAAAVGRRRDVT